MAGRSVFQFQEIAAPVAPIAAAEADPGSLLDTEFPVPRRARPRDQNWHRDEFWSIVIGEVPQPDLGFVFDNNFPMTRRAEPRVHDWDRDMLWGVDLNTPIDIDGFEAVWPRPPYRRPVQQPQWDSQNLERNLFVERDIQLDEWYQPFDRPLRRANWVRWLEFDQLTLTDTQRFEPPSPDGWHVGLWTGQYRRKSNYAHEYTDLDLTDAQNVPEPILEAFESPFPEVRRRRSWAYRQVPFGLLDLTPDMYPEVITMDKWFAPFPMTRRARPRETAIPPVENYFEGNFSFAVVLFDSYHLSGGLMSW